MMLYGLEHLALKLEKLNVIEIRMLRWMYGENRNIKVRNEYIIGA